MSAPSDQQTTDRRADRHHRSALHDDVDVTELQAWADALAYLRLRGLAGIAPVAVRRALAAAPQRYGVVSTGWWSP